MKKSRHRLAIAAAAMIAMTGLPPPAASATSRPSWVTQTLLAIGGEDVRPLATAATSGGDVWVAGYVYTGIEFRTLAMRRHSGRWATVPTPDVETAPAQDFLNGVVAASPTDVWMVGSSDTSSSNRSAAPLVEHWDGRSVSIVASPDPQGGFGSGLEAVTGDERDLWAVGHHGDAQDNSAGLVLHRNATTWTNVPFHVLAPGCNDTTGSSLLSVVEVADGDVYVGGTCPTSTYSKGFVERYSDGSWTLSATTPPVGAIDSLTEASDGTVWAAGTQQSHGGGAGWLRGVALHGSGSTFTSYDQPIPKAGVYDGFAGIATAGASVVTVGTGTSAQPPFSGFGAYTHSGSTWVADRVRDPFGGFGNFGGVTVDSGGHFVAAGFGLASSGHDVALVSERSG